MGLLESLQSKPQPRGRDCRMAYVLRQLTDEEVTEVTRIMDSIVALEGLYTASWLTQQLKANGHQINHATLLRHARKDCCCYAS